MVKFLDYTKPRTIKTAGGFIKTSGLAIDFNALSSRGSNARLTKISKNRASAISNYWTSGGGKASMSQANAIRKQLGQKPIEVKTRRRRRGRYTTYTTGDVAGTIAGHQKKVGLTKWAKGFGLKIDPNKTVTVQTGIQTIRRSYTRTIHNGRRVSGYSLIDKPIIKQVKFKDATPAYQTQFLYDKFNKELAVKKSRYVKLFEPTEENRISGEISAVDNSINSLKSKIKKMTFYRYRSGSSSARAQAQRVAPVRDALSKKEDEKKQLQQELENVGYSYYSVSDKQLDEAEAYKKDLIGAIKETDKTTDEMLRKLPSGKPDDDSHKKYEEWRLKKLESEYDEELEEYKDAVDKTVRREETFDRYSQTTRSKLNPVKLAKGNVRRNDNRQPRLSKQRGTLGVTPSGRFARW